MITKKKQPQQTKYKKTNPNYMSFDTVDFKEQRGNGVPSKSQSTTLQGSWYMELLQHHIQITEKLTITEKLNEHL